MGSPPPDGSKNTVLKFRSVNNIVMAPAKTGRDNNKSTAVIKTDQINSGSRLNNKPRVRMFQIVTIKFMAPAIEDIPAKCKLKIAKSTEGPQCAIMLLKGGYTVHPVPTPGSTILDNNNKSSAGGNSQKLKLFSLGNAISGAPNKIGTNQLPKPPIRAGITIKKIITNACAVTITLYSWQLPFKMVLPGVASSQRINMDNPAPIIPDKAAKSKYKVPISL